MFVYTLNALLWNIVHHYVLKKLNMDIIKKPSLKVKAYAVRTGLTESLIKTDIQSVIRIFHKKHPALHLLHFYVFPIGICLVPTLQS